jgi:hypothetical protein
MIRLEVIDKLTLLLAESVEYLLLILQDVFHNQHYDIVITDYTCYSVPMLEIS